VAKFMANFSSYEQRDLDERIYYTEEILVIISKFNFLIMHRNWIFINLELAIKSL
jgi:hypothetical protein